MTPTERAEMERDPNYVPDREIEARIKRVGYETRDYGNITSCTITFDNSLCVVGEVERRDDDMARTAAYTRALNAARIGFQWARAEHAMWARAQMADEGMLAALGHTGGE